MRELDFDYIHITRPGDAAGFPYHLLGLSDPITRHMAAVGHTATICWWRRAHFSGCRTLLANCSIMATRRFFLIFLFVLYIYVTFLWSISSSYGVTPSMLDGSALFIRYRLTLHSDQRLLAFESSFRTLLGLHCTQIQGIYPSQRVWN